MDSPLSSFIIFIRNCSWFLSTRDSTVVSVFKYVCYYYVLFRYFPVVVLIRCFIPICGNALPQVLARYSTPATGVAEVMAAYIYIYIAGSIRIDFEFCGCLVVLFLP